MFRLFSEPILAPIDNNSASGTGVAQPLGKEEMVDFLNDDEKDVIELEAPPKEKQPHTKEIPSPQEDEEESDDSEAEGEPDDELKDLEEELEGPKDEDLELVTPVRRREILKKYPNLFKDFPYLEKAYYREQQFTEQFATIEDARVASSKAQILDRFENEIINEGSTYNILQAVHDENPQAFFKLVDNYLPTLAQVDEKAYHHVLGNVTKHTIMAMVNEGKRQSNDTLISAAQILNQFVFGSSDFQPPRNLSKRQTDETKDFELQEREAAFTRTQFESTRTDLNSKVNNTLRNTIDAHIDPKNSMTDYVRKNASRECLEQLEVLMAQDTRFRTLTDKLWERVFETNFSPDAVAKVKTAYLSKAKTLLPTVIKKARNEALRGLGKRVRDDEDSGESETVSRPTGRTERPRSNVPSGKIRSAKDIPKNMKTLDFLMRD